MVSASSSKLPSKAPRPESTSAERVPEDVTPQDPAAAFATILDARHEVSCVKLLNEDFDSVTQSGSAFEWLKDTKVLGLTPNEIVSLLIEESVQSPWIRYKMSRTAQHVMQVMLDRAEHTQSVSPQRLGHSMIGTSNTEVKRMISEIIGLGGIIPDPSYCANLEREVNIDRSSGRAEIIYQPLSERTSDPSWRCSECVYKLERLLALLRWLQSYGLNSDHFIIFRVNPDFEVEGVQVPIENIENLRECALRTAKQIAQGGVGSYRDELSTAAATILRLTAWSYPPRGLADGAIYDCALAAQALCITMLSLAQSHIGEIDPFFLEQSLSLIRLDGGERHYLYYRLVSLTCAGDMVDSQVMAFADRVTEINEPCGLVITPEDLLDVWGPVDLISSRTSDREGILPARWLRGIAIRGGIIYKPSANSFKLHWKAGTAEDALTQIEFMMLPQTQITIGGLDLVNEACPLRPDRDNTIPRKNINSVIEELGTWPEKWKIREKQGGLQSGQFINASFNATWIKSDSRTRKQKGMERVDLDFLNKPWGLLVSLCTGVARRVALREIVARSRWTKQYTVQAPLSKLYRLNFTGGSLNFSTMHPLCSSQHLAVSSEQETH